MISPCIHTHRLHVLLLNRLEESIAQNDITESKLERARARIEELEEKLGNLTDMHQDACVEINDLNGILKQYKTDEVRSIHIENLEKTIELLKGEVASYDQVSHSCYHHHYDLEHLPLIFCTLKANCY